MRLVPMKKIVGKFPRVVRDLAREQNKDIDFEMNGTDVELDRTILDRLSDPLIHILRNAVDHGIESPEEREAAGKDPEGSIVLEARRERDRAIIQVEDDGGGLDADEIRKKAFEQEIRDSDELEQMDDENVYDLIFHPGFSTTDEVTDVSGRGVGMDVVHNTVTRLDGSVNVDSEPGEGTTVTLELPVSIAIVKVLFVEAGDHEFGIPIKKIDKVSRYEGAESVNGDEMIEHDEELYNVIHLHEALDTVIQNGDGSGDEDVEDGMLIRVRGDERRVALYCDTVSDQEEVVVKPLEGVLSGTPGLSGTAVLGEGNVVPVLDVKTI
jgi:two-component system chemotaxis sensor kinase CheA